MRKKELGKIIDLMAGEEKLEKMGKYMKEGLLMIL